MPHVVIKTYPIPEEQKVQLAEEIQQLIMKVTGKPEDFISIDIKDVPESEWMNKVYEPEIRPALETLYKKPGY